MIERKEYLEKLFEWKDKAVIKVVTGIRRSGKSTLLEQYRARLREGGVSKEQIVSINFEELEHEALQDRHELYAFLKGKLRQGQMTYIFLDEVQKVDGFEQVVDSLYVKENVDLYITGSNSWLLSGELATLLSGRYIEIGMLPFSFAEFSESRGGGDPDRLFAEYMADGGFPYLAALNGTRESVDIYLEGIYNTVILKDIEERQRRRAGEPDRRRVTDLALLKNISKFLASSVGSPVSVKKIADFITSSGRKVSQNTVDDYVEALVQAFVFYRAERYDVEGKQLLAQNAKFYIVDLGLRRYLLPRRNYDLGFSLENIVYLELRRRGFSVNVGKVGASEVDFVARKGDEITYFQVSASLTDESTFAREIAPMRKIGDDHRKKILTLDRFTPGNYDGIEVIHAADWLLEG